MQQAACASAWAWPIRTWSAYSVLSSCLPPTPSTSLTPHYIPSVCQYWSVCAACKGVVCEELIKWLYLSVYKTDKNHIYMHVWCIHIKIILIALIFEILMYTFLLMLYVVVCSPMSVRYGTTGMTVTKNKSIIKLLYFLGSMHFCFHVNAPNW